MASKKLIELEREVARLRAIERLTKSRAFYNGVEAAAAHVCTIAVRDSRIGEVGGDAALDFSIDCSGEAAGLDWDQFDRVLLSMIEALEAPGDDNERLPRRCSACYYVAPNLITGKTRSTQVPCFGPTGAEMDPADWCPIRKACEVSDDEE